MGVQALGGVKCFLHKHIGVFVAYRFSYSGTGLGVALLVPGLPAIGSPKVGTDPSAHHIYGGVSFHFDVFWNPASQRASRAAGQPPVLFCLRRPPRAIGAMLLWAWGALDMASRFLSAPAAPPAGSGGLPRDAAAGDRSGKRWLGRWGGPSQARRVQR